MVTMSARLNSSSFDTFSTPSSSQRSCFRFGDQAMTSSPNFGAISATMPPSLPRPTTPRVLPETADPVRSCQPPCFMVR